jgi:galactokinase
MNDILIKKRQFFQETFGYCRKIVLSPGRIIIGEHIDYNDGYVLPAAIDKIICFAFEKNNTNQSVQLILMMNSKLTIRSDER